MTTATKIAPAKKPDANREQPAKVPVVERVRIDRIRVASTNPRIKGCDSQEELVGLADSIVRNGLMQPVGVRRIDSDDQAGFTHELVWGSRRLQACKALHWDEIDAVEVQADEGEAAEMRAVENLHRRPMNALEELMAVEAMMNAPTGAVRSTDQAVAETAAAMGRSISWVRDRRYMARLGPKARKMLMEGVLTVGHARELAKVVDHRQQDELIKEMWDRFDQIPSVERLREVCNRAPMSLHQVPWQLEATSVGDAAAPACTACPHNSNNDAHLFEHDGKKPKLGDGKWNGKVGDYEYPKGPFCTNAGCYAAKHKACQKAIEVVIKKAEKVATADDAPATKGKKAKGTPAPKTTVRQIEFHDVDQDTVPEFVDLDALERTIEARNLEAEQAAKVKPSGSQVTVAERERKYKEQEKKRKEKEAATKKLRQQRFEALRKIPGAMTAFVILADARDQELHKVFGRCISFSKSGGRDDHQLTPSGTEFFQSLAGGLVTLSDLDKLVESKFNEQWCEAPWEKFSARLGRYARPYFENVLFGTPMPAAPAKDKPAKGKAKKGGAR